MPTKIAETVAFLFMTLVLAAGAAAVAIDATVGIAPSVQSQACVPASCASAPGQAMLPDLTRLLPPTS